MSERLPFEQSLANLRRDGKQFDQRQSRIPLGDGFTHLDWKRNQVPAMVDAAIICEAGVVYAQDRLVQSKLDEIRGGSPAESMATYLTRKIQDPRLIIGFSGYASDGFGYEAEADGIQEVTKSFRSNALGLGLVVDGGTSLGVPGLSGLIAEGEGTETLGAVPLEGLRSVGRRDTVIVLGKQYGDETELIGRLPDVLFILGGGPNATREYLEALRAGNIVVMMKLKDYPDNSLVNTFESLPDTAVADARGQLTICNRLQDIPAIVSSLSITNRVEKAQYFEKKG